MAKHSPNLPSSTITAKISSFGKKRSVVVGGLLIIILLALLLRSHIYIHGDFFYLLDQARDLMLVKDIVLSHKLALIGARSGLGGIFHGPLWLYIVSPFFMIFHGNPFWTLVPLFLIISVGIVLFGVFIIYRLYGVLAALAVGFLLALSPSLLAANLITTNAQVMPLVFLLYFWGIIEYLRGKDACIILAIFAIGLGFQFESAFSIFLLPLTLLAILISKRIPRVKYLITSAVLFLISIANFLLFEIRHQFLMTHAALGLLTNKVDPLKGYEKFANIGYRVGDRLHLLQDHFVSFLFQKDQLSMLLAILIQLFALVVIIQSLRDHKKNSQEAKEYLFLFIIPFLYYGLYILYPMPLWSHYLLTVDVIAALFVGLSLKIIIKNRYGKLLSLFFVLLLCTQAFSWIQTNYITHPYTPTTDGSYLNQLRVVQAVVQDAKQKKSGYFEYTNGILTYQIDYLMWYNNNRYHTNMVNTKEPISYMIMYPPPGGDNNAHQFWKTNTVRTKGEVLFHRVYPGGIVLEKLAVSENEPDPDPNYYQGLLFR